MRGNCRRALIYLKGGMRNGRFYVDLSDRSGVIDLLQCLVQAGCIRRYIRVNRLIRVYLRGETGGFGRSLKIVKGDRFRN